MEKTERIALNKRRYEVYAQYRDKYSYTDYYISKECGIPKSTIYDWKKGKFRLKDDKRRVIAQYFDVSLDYLDGLTKFRRTYGWEQSVKEVEKPLYQVADLIREEQVKRLIEVAESVVY